jgi:hypothetical protein
MHYPTWQQILVLCIRILIDKPTPISADDIIKPPFPRWIR